MADSLPLIPAKRGVCADVQRVLREVFKELDFFPPLAPERQGPEPVEYEENKSTIITSVNQWINEYDSVRKDIWSQEGELQQQYAKRIARDPLPNIYRLYRPLKKLDKVLDWKSAQGLLDRKDLMPSLSQNAVNNDCLWVKNILNRSSGDLTSLIISGSKLQEPVHLDAKPTEFSLQSVSMGELRSQVHQPGPSSSLSSPEKMVILCVPPQLEFVNFTIGQLHTKYIRLVNVSKFEVRLSIRPPSRHELNIELAGTRGLTVTSGAATEIRVHFRPKDVRVLRDVLLVRVSVGKSISVPISCYMHSPCLDILVPAVSPSIFSCTPGHVESCVTHSTDCLELGARLLGDVHCVPVLYYCDSEHATFFLLPEDTWLSFCVDTLTSRGSVVVAPFVLWPALWQGGGAVRGCVWCRAGGAGLHAAAFRIVSSTAVIRPLNLLADALFYRPEHISLEAQEKDYDICSDDEPACEYYVHLGTAFSHRALSAKIQLVNHSPVIYNYYWSVRPWAACSCWEDEQAEEQSVGSEVGSERLCAGAKEARNEQMKGGPDLGKNTNAKCLRVEPARGALAPRAACAVHVCAPDAGGTLGVQRAVLMLILQNVPKESFPLDYDPMIVKTEVVQSDPIPGVKGWTREVCEVVCAQMEVWWEVEPVRFVLDPPVLPLVCSRRIDSLDVVIRAIQLFGNEGISCSWQLPPHLRPPPAVVLFPAQSCEQKFKYPLPVLSNECSETDIIRLEAVSSEWMSQCLVSRQVATRHPALRPARAWLGVLPPSAHLHASLEVVNDTYQHICWWAEAFRWYGENPPHVMCTVAGRPSCDTCRQHDCTCALVRPTLGALHHGEGKEIIYDVNTPVGDGCVATLVRVRRTGADVAQAAGGAATAARATLLTYRVLAPRLVITVRQCGGDTTECDSCALDEGELRSERGTAILRPKTALSLARRTCYRLRVTNLTPLPTRVKWDPALEEDVLKVIFIPKEFNVGSYAQVELQVILEARQVCGRQLYVHRAQVLHAYKPIYLVIDTAISGLEILCEVPLGGGEKTEKTLIMRRNQAEIYSPDQEMPSSPEEIFEEEDRQRLKSASIDCELASSTYFALLLSEYNKDWCVINSAGSTLHSELNFSSVIIDEICSLI